MTRRYAAFDPESLGPDLVAVRGGTVLTTLVPGLDYQRTARLSVPAQDFESFAEFVVFGDAGSHIEERMAIGVVTIDADLAAVVGSDSSGLAFNLSELGVYHNGILQSPVRTTVGLGSVIGVRYTPGEAGAGRVAFYHAGKQDNGSVPVASVAVPAAMEGKPLYLACSLGSDRAPEDLGIQVNSGQDWYEYPVAGAAAGWWEAPALPGTLRFADTPFVSPRSDATPYQRWEGGITANLIDDDRGVHFWIWGRDRSQARSSAAVVEVLDSEGRLDDALGGVYRDQPASLHLADDSFDDSIGLGSYIVERIDAVDALKRKITLKGPLAAFEVPMLRRAVRPDADPDAVGSYYPMLIGPAFSCPVRLLTKADRVYAIDAIGVQVVGKVRDNGVALDPAAPDYSLHAGGQRLELLSEPYGTVTVDAAATGAGYVPPTAPDVLDGDGAPFDGDPVSGWAVVDGAGTPPSVDAQGRLRLWLQGGWGRIKHSTAVLTAGRSYRWTITVNVIRQHFSGEQPVVVGFDARDSGWNSLYWQAQSRMVGQAGIESGGIVHRTQPTTFEGIYTPAVSHAPTISWRDFAAPEPGLSSALISNVTFTELPEPEDADEDEIEAEIAALGRPLEVMLREGIEVRCGISPETWDAASAAAIDMATGFTGQGYYAHSQVKLCDYIDDLLAPYLASAFEAADGRLTFARLVDPETVSITGIDITAADVLNDPQPEWDDMPGLTVSIGCRRNEHVFSADELGDALPWAARPKLTKPYRYERRYGGPLAVGLDHARAADTLDSRLVVPEDAAAAADYVGQLASVPRAFFDIRVPNAGRWEVAQVARLYLPRWFKDGDGWRQVFITRIRGSRQPVGTLRVWTRAPWNQ